MIVSIHKYKLLISVPFDQLNALRNASTSVSVDQDCWAWAWHKDIDRARASELEHVHIATKWCPTMNLATKCAENV